MVFRPRGIVRLTENANRATWESPRLKVIQLMGGACAVMGAYELLRQLLVHK
jgi:hypothetical protein